MTNFPEIHPLNASPEISAIYADIRAVSGLQMVNLIWRHFAALPNVLEWAWAGVRPLVGSQEMAAARHRLIYAVELPAIAPVSLQAWDAAGVGPSQMHDFQSMLAAYIRGNCTNMIALTALRLRLEGVDGASAALSAAPLPATAAQLPPLPRIDTLDPALATAIRNLAQHHEGAQGGIIPSLYLELVRWPGLIETFPNWLGALYAPQAMLAARASTIRAAEAEALAMLPTMGPPPQGIEAMRPALAHFTRLVIPDLIPVCIAADRLLPK